MGAPRHSPPGWLSATQHVHPLGRTVSACTGSAAGRMVALNNGLPCLSSLQAPHQCLWTLLERHGANTEAFSLIYCRVTWMCILSLSSRCSCHFWHPLHSVLSSLGPQKLFFLSLGATVLPYSSAKLRTRLEWLFPRPREPYLRREQSPFSHLSRKGFTPGVPLAGYQNSRLVHPLEGSQILACPKAAGADRACVATLSPSLILLGPSAGNHTA